MSLKTEWRKNGGKKKKESKVQSAMKKIPETCTRVFHIIYSGNVNEKEANEGWEKPMCRTEPNSSLLSFMQVKFNSADVIFH